MNYHQNQIKKEKRSFFWPIVFLLSSIVFLVVLMIAFFFFFIPKKKDVFNFEYEENEHEERGNDSDVLDEHGEETVNVRVEIERETGRRQNNMTWLPVIMIREELYRVFVGEPLTIVSAALRGFVEYYHELSRLSARLSGLIQTSLDGDDENDGTLRVIFLCFVGYNNFFLASEVIRLVTGYSISMNTVYSFYFVLFHVLVILVLHALLFYFFPFLLTFLPYVPSDINLWYLPFFIKVILFLVHYLLTIASFHS